MTKAVVNTGSDTALSHPCRLYINCCRTDPLSKFRNVYDDWPDGKEDEEHFNTNQAPAPAANTRKSILKESGGSKRVSKEVKAEPKAEEPEDEIEMRSSPSEVGAAV